MHTLRRTFDQAAELYLHARPAYPKPLYQQLWNVCRLSERSRLLEVGCGPGNATKPLAQAGLHIDAVDPGANLLAQAKQHLEGLAVDFHCCDFEKLEVPNGLYDLVYSATAWHWIDPAQRYAKAAQLLKPTGYLAFWEARHVFPEGADPFFRDIQRIYDEIGEGVPPGTVWPKPGELSTSADEIEDTGLFEVVHIQQFDWLIAYSAEQYIDLLSTFSGHIAMPSVRRSRLFDAIRSYVSSRDDEPIQRGWGCVLHIAAVR